MYWVLYIVGRDASGHTNYTRVQLSILSTCIPFFGGLCVRVLPSGSSVAVLGTLEDAKIPHAFNSLFFLIGC